jgi:hypothetical protein
VAVRWEKHSLRKYGRRTRFANCRTGKPSCSSALISSTRSRVPRHLPCSGNWGCPYPSRTFATVDHIEPFRRTASTDLVEFRPDDPTDVAEFVAAPAAAVLEHLLAPGQLGRSGIIGGLMTFAACGQTMTHFPHWIQRSGLNIMPASEPRSRFCKDWTGRATALARTQRVSAGLSKVPVARKFSASNIIGV